MKNVTKGIARINPKSKTSVEIAETGRSLCTTGGYFYNKEADKVDAENEANALLYLDAHNTHNATGYTPSELKQQRDELMEFVTHVRSYSEDSYLYNKSRELIQKLSNENS